jgi:hypothetical protein
VATGLTDPDGNELVVGDLEGTGDRQAALRARSKAKFPRSLSKQPTRSCGSTATGPVPLSLVSPANSQRASSIH